jgi:hypothetical protein
MMVNTYRVASPHEAIDVNRQSLVLLLLVFILLGTSHGDEYFVVLLPLGDSVDDWG